MATSRRVPAHMARFFPAPSLSNGTLARERSYCRLRGSIILRRVSLDFIAGLPRDNSSLAEFALCGVKHSTMHLPRGGAAAASASCFDLSRRTELAVTAYAASCSDLCPRRTELAVIGCELL